MSCLEFLPSPGQEVIPLDNDFGKDRKSTDHILEPQDLAFPWPLRPKDDKRRQTMHANWTLRQGVSGDGRTAERPATATTRSGLPADSGNMV